MGATPPEEGLDVGGVGAEGVVAVLEDFGVFLEAKVAEGLVCVAALLVRVVRETPGG